MNPFDAVGDFVPPEKGQEIRRLAVKGVGFTTLAQVLGLLIQVISAVILGRMLMPADFGLVTMVTTFSLLLVNAGGNGFTEVLLQRKHVNRFGASNLFWINVATGLILASAFAASAPLIARFYGNASVTRVVVAMSLTIAITSTGVIHIALLMRGMRFQAVAANQILSRFVSVAVSVVLAWMGWHYWALVAGAIAQTFSEAVGSWILCGWMPGLPRRVNGTGSMVWFAANVYGRFSFNYFSRNVDNLLVGWRFNVQSLGFYKKAYDLFALSAMLSAFTPVAVSTLSRLSDDPPRYKRFLLGALSVSAFLGMGIGGALTLVGRDFIRIMLGPKWGEAGHIFTFFGPGFGVMFVYGIHGWIHLSLGTPGRWLRWGIFEFCATASLFLLALRWGPAAVAASWSVSLFVLTIPAMWYAIKPIQFGITSIIAALWKFSVASLLAGFATVFVLTVGHFQFSTAVGTLGEVTIRFARNSLMFSAIYIAIVVMLHRGLAPLRQVVDLLREMMTSRKMPAEVSVTTGVEVQAVRGG